MANITNYLKYRLNQQSLGKAPSLWHSQTYAGLFVSSPDETYTWDNNGVGNEVQGTNYSRIEIIWPPDPENLPSSPYWSMDQYTGYISNVNDLVWEAQGNWAGSTGASSPAPIVSVGIFDSSAENGNLLWFGPLSAPVTLADGDSFTIASGGLVITLT